VATVAQRDINRRAILKIVRPTRKSWVTREQIEYATGLDIREIMDVTGHFPYNFIGTRKGYKHIKAASPREITEAVNYNLGKVRAIQHRVTAMQHQLYTR
jgi:hypothetical protein